MIFWGQLLYYFKSKTHSNVNEPTFKTLIFIQVKIQAHCVLNRERQLHFLLFQETLKP